MFLVFRFRIQKGVGQIRGYHKLYLVLRWISVTNVVGLAIVVSRQWSAAQLSGYKTRHPARDAGSAIGEKGMPIHG